MNCICIQESINNSGTVWGAAAEGCCLVNCICMQESIKNSGTVLGAAADHCTAEEEGGWRGREEEKEEEKDHA